MEKDSAENLEVHLLALHYLLHCLHRLHFFLFRSCRRKNCTRLGYLAPLHLLFIVLIVNGRQTDGKRRSFLILRIDWSYLELTRYFFIDVGVSIHHVELGWLYSRILSLHNWRPWSSLFMAQAILFHENVLGNCGLRSYDCRDVH